MVSENAITDLEYRQFQSRIAEAYSQALLQELTAALSANPADYRLKNLLAHCLVRDQQPERALVLFKQAQAQQPDHVDFCIDLAFCARQLGQHAESARALSAALEREPDNFWLWLEQAKSQFAQGDIAGCRHSAQTAEQCDPFAAELRQAATELQQGDRAQCERRVRRIRAQFPGHPAATLLLSELALSANAVEEAYRLLEKALALHPFHLGLNHKMIRAAGENARTAMRVKAATTVVTLQPGDGLALCALALAQVGNGDFNGAAEVLARVVERCPELPQAWFQQGHVAKTLGQRELAVQSYRAALAFEPYKGAAWWALADLKHYIFGDEEVTQMQRDLIHLSEKGQSEQQSQLHFALGKAFEDRRDYATSFAHYDKGNALRAHQYQPADFERHCDSSRCMFHSGALKIVADRSSLTTPIFIVGLPRTGSTLVEQILASHSQVEGTMELPHLPQLMFNLFQTKKVRQGLPESEIIQNLSLDELNQLAQDYLDGTAPLRSGKPYFIDKLPPNFRLVGLIYKLFPHAIVIDTRRQPMSSGFSIFKQHFAVGHDFSYSLVNIGHYYRCYRGLMEYWHKHLPGFVKEVRYESLIDDPQKVIAKLLNDCGLSHERPCFEHHRNQRPVHTASSEQVRQPLHRQALEQWRHYEAWLEPLKQSLEQ